MFRIGIDVGGTFTDFAVWKSENDGYTQIESYKIPTSRPDFARGVKEGIADIVRRVGIDPNAPTQIIHGTTIGLNAVIERSEKPVALLVTRGYRDLLQIGRLRFNESEGLFSTRAEPLTPRELVFEIDERLIPSGAVETPLDENSVRTALETARRKGVITVAVALLHSYRNPVHELRVLDIARESFPDIEVVVSHQVWAQESEYERAVLTLINAYIKRLVGGYISEITRFLADELPGSDLYIAKSNGGMISSEEARSLPIQSLFSGPAAGVNAARTVSGFLGLDRVLTLDMGGTSTDVSLIEDGRAMTTAQAEVGDFPILMPTTAVDAVGAGGGSIIWVDEGVMKVGPRSAGSSPGPACYGAGGRQPTLTDAYLICNLLPEEGLLGGKVPLHRERAESAFAPICAQLGIDTVTAAESAVTIATSNMLAGILPYLARVGIQPSDCNLMLFGGAGGLQGPMLADELGIRRVVMPRGSPVFCAFGCLVSDLAHDAVKSVHGRALSDEALADVLADLTRQGDSWLERQIRLADRPVVERHYRADMRYVPQSFSIPVDIEAVGENATLDEACARFHCEHRRLFGHADPSAPVAIDAIHLKSTVRQPKPVKRSLPSGGAPVPLKSRTLRLNGRWHDDCPVYAYDHLAPGFAIAGPAMIEQNLTTLLVPYGFDATMGELGDIHLERVN